MTNDTVPHENGVADPAALSAITTAETTITPLEAPPPPPAPTFDDLGLHPDVKLALDDMGYFTPTPVQTAVFKPVTEGKDLLVQSRTGTGKTTAFGLPIINSLIPAHRSPQALILLPTRELALQVARELSLLGKHRGIVVEPIYGGAPIGKQIKALQDGVHIVVGTPGRVLDLIGRRVLDCRTVQTFILDECDEMLSMGFLEDIERVVANLPEKKQTLLFSATMPEEVSRYARRHMKAPEQIALSKGGISVADIHHAYYIVSGIARSRDLLKIILSENPESALIFCNMRDETTMVAKFLQKQGLDAEPLSSDLSQADRERVMNRMKAHDLRFLCATDVASRGIDITSLTHVINYSVPESPEVYVHRTGRTGRAGKKGTAISMVGPRELGNFRYVRLQFGIKFEERVLPKDSIFEGKLKVPLPPIGLPQAPDPVQILLRGIPIAATGPTDLERQIFEKLLASSKGKAALTQLVADKLNQISTKTKPRVRTERIAPVEGEERHHDGPPPPSGSSEDRPRRSFDGPREDRPRDDRGPRRSFDGPRDDRGPRRDRGDRPGGDRPDRGGEDRPRRPYEGSNPRHGDRAMGDRPAPSGTGEHAVVPAAAVGDAPASESTQRTDRPQGERPPWRDDGRGDGRQRRDYRDRDGRRDRPDHARDAAPPATSPSSSAPVISLPADPQSAPPSAVAVEAVVTESVSPAAELRNDARPNDRDRDRDGGRGRGRDRDRHDRSERSDRHAQPVAAAPVEAPAAVVPEAPAPAPVKAEAPAAAPERGKKRGDRKAEAPTEATREFWETWAEEKSTRPEPAPAVVAPAAEAADAVEETEARPKGRGRAGARPAKRDDKPAPRGKRDTEVAPPPVAAAAPAADANQARLFVSLGKKHGVSADDLRTLLAGPVGGDKARIGSVSLRDSHAHVRVPEDLVDAIIAGVHGKQHKDQDVTVERSRA